MKTLANLFFITLFFLTSSCNKATLDKDENLSLIGKWNLTETLADPGDGSGKWKAVSKSAPVQDIEFKENGELEGSYFVEYTTYKLKDSLTFTVIREDKSEQNYAYIIKNGLLSISPAGPMMCNEGCGSRFARID